jgi:hypothetical protein
VPTHVIKQGEHISRIADEAGFADPDTIWSHSENASLRELRGDPNVLMPGDELFIPERTEKEESCATEAKHTFRFRGRQLMLKVRLLGFDDEPLPDTPCELHVDDQVHSLTTDADGRIEQVIPATAESGRLIFEDPLVPFDRSIRIEIGHLDPIAEPSGQRARLANLGYFFSHGDERDDERFDAAMQEFQCDHGLTVDGICGPKTQAKLKEIYGC